MKRKRGRNINGWYSGKEARRWVEESAIHFYILEKLYVRTPLFCLSILPALFLLFALFWAKRSKNRSKKSAREPLPNIGINDVRLLIHLALWSSLPSNCRTDSDELKEGKSFGSSSSLPSPGYLNSLKLRQLRMEDQVFHEKMEREWRRLGKEMRRRLIIIMEFLPLNWIFSHRHHTNSSSLPVHSSIYSFIPFFFSSVHSFKEFLSSFWPSSLMIIGSWWCWWWSWEETKKAATAGRGGRRGYMGCIRSQIGLD